MMYDDEVFGTGLLTRGKKRKKANGLQKAEHYDRQCVTNVGEWVTWKLTADQRWDGDDAAPPTAASSSVGHHQSALRAGKENTLLWTPAYPIYASRQKVIRYAYENDIPIPEASRLLRQGSGQNGSSAVNPKRWLPQTDTRSGVLLNSSIQSNIPTVTAIP